MLDKLTQTSGYNSWSEILGTNNSPARWTILKTWRSQLPPSRLSANVFRHCNDRESSLRIGSIDRRPSRQPYQLPDSFRPDSFFTGLKASDS